MSSGCEIAQMGFVDIVVEAIIPDINELRIILTDGSFVDVWFSLKIQGRYNFHVMAPVRMQPLIMAQGLPLWDILDVHVATCHLAAWERTETD